MVDTYIESHELCPRSLESLSEVQSIAEKTYHQKKHKNPLEYVIFEDQ